MCTKGRVNIVLVCCKVSPMISVRKQAPEADYLDAAVVSVLQIHLTQPPGDVLVSCWIYSRNYITLYIIYYSHSHVSVH